MHVHVGTLLEGNCMMAVWNSLLSQPSSLIFPLPVIFLLFPHSDQPECLLWMTALYCCWWKESEDNLWKVLSCTYNFDNHGTLQHALDAYLYCTKFFHIDTHTQRKALKYWETFAWVHFIVYYSNYNFMVLVFNSLSCLLNFDKGDIFHVIVPLLAQ